MTTRPSWEEIPAQLRDRLQDAIGPVIKTESVTDGIMPGAAVRLHLDNRPGVFLKAIPADHPAAHLIERQRWAGQVLPAGAPTPRMLWSSCEAGWIAVAHAYVPDARPADLSPGSPDLPAATTLLDDLADTLTPAPQGARPISDNINPLLAKARLMLDKHAARLDAADRELYQRALHGFTPAMLDGDTLIHYDLHSENILITSAGPQVVDWSFATRAAAWADAALVAPRLVEYGHRPGQAEELLARLHAAPRDALSGLAALWTLFRVYKATFGPPETRAFRARAAAAGFSWMVHLTR